MDVHTTESVLSCFRKKMTSFENLESRDTWFRMQQFRVYQSTLYLVYQLVAESAQSCLPTPCKTTVACMRRVGACQDRAATHTQCAAYSQHPARPHQSAAGNCKACTHLTPSPPPHLCLRATSCRTSSPYASCMQPLTLPEGLTLTFVCCKIGAPPAARNTTTTAGYGMKHEASWCESSIHIVERPDVHPGMLSA